MQAVVAGVDRSLATRYFEAWVLRLAGIFPVPEVCPQCGRQLEVAGVALLASGESMVCRSCGGAEGGAKQVSPQAVRFLRQIDRAKLVDLDRERPASSTLDEGERVCTLVRRRCVQLELSSYRVIRETIAGLPGEPNPSPDNH